MPAAHRNRPHSDGPRLGLHPLPAAAAAPDNDNERAWAAFQKLRAIHEARLDRIRLEMAALGVDWPAP